MYFTDIPHFTYSISLFTAAIFVCFSVISGYPLPLDTIFISFFYGHFASLTSNEGVNTHLQKMSSTCFISYLVMPVVSACFTWFTYRILILGIMNSDEEDRFNMTLSWCGIIYPTAISASITILVLKLFLHSRSFRTRTLLGCLVIIVSWILAFVFFKVFLRAWVKRRAFLMYPQEYAVYMERSEKLEQGDREARGLGPIKDYYLPKTSVANSTSASTNGAKLPLPSTLSLKDNNSAVEPVISPAVIAGKLAINFKRAEELFTPILNVTSVVSLFLFSSFESSNLYRIISRSINAKPSIWVVLPAILVGSLLLSNRHGQYLGRKIIPDMRLSQAFSIQLGVLLTLTLALLYSIPLAPMWYLLASIAAVCASNPDRSSQVLKQPSFHETTSKDEEEMGSFRSKLMLMMFFWACSIVFGYSVGFLSPLV